MKLLSFLKINAEYLLKRESLLLIKLNNRNMYTILKIPQYFTNPHMLYTVIKKNC